MFAGLLGPAAASAYDPAPLCAYPMTPDLGASSWYGNEPARPAAHQPSSTRLMCAPEGDAAPELGPIESLGVDHAVEALEAARRLADSGRHADAVLQVRQVAEAVPELADRMALLEADYRMAAGPSEAACDAYERAMESEHRTISLRARVGWVRCLLDTDHRDGPEELGTLRRRYPELPQRAELELALAASYDRQGDREEAGAVYRRIDLLEPGSPIAAEARARLSALRADGVDVRELTLTQQVDRAERLVRSGPMDDARSEVARLMEVELPTPLRQQLARSAARIARVEGRWEEASRLLRQARGLPELEQEDREAMAARIDDLERAAETREAQDVRRRIRAMTRGRPIARQGTARLFAILRIAARAQQVDLVDEALEEIRDRRRIPPGLRFDAAILAAGTGDDEHVEALFASARRHPTYGVAARYHRARTLERMGRRGEAIEEYARVIRDDSRTLPYYAMWSRQRLRALRPPATETRLPVAAAACEQFGPFCLAPMGVAKTGELEPEVVPPLLSMPTNPFSEDDASSVPAEGEVEELDIEAELAQPSSEETPDVSLTDEEIDELLGSVIEGHGEAYPWIERARTLVRMGERRAATDELHEVYTAWRDATGQGSLRAGLAGVLRGGAPPRHRVSMATWRARRHLDSDARRALARVCAALGDYGMAIRFVRSFEITGAHPRAYEDLVTAAARRHGIEPELLFAVMRVESVYNPRIISYAGAIGLAQIMPRTGRLIAASLGRDEFTVDQLLEPEVNLEFAAWYLSSLIERWDGRIPLAIASYNGGPHNVRRWMRDYSPDMPLDAFLERIEFDQTHRYVRRVMTHYEAYRAQRDEHLRPMAMTLPEPRPDAVAF